MKKRMLMVALSILCALPAFQSAAMAEETNVQPVDELEPARINGPAWPHVAPELRIAAQDDIERLGSTDPGERRAARSDLSGWGKPVIPVLVEGLYAQNPLARTNCATLLGDMSAQNAVKYLIEAFYSAMPDSGQAATYQRTFVRGLKEALEKTTGRAFIRVEARSPIMQEGLQQYIRWYNENFDRLPRQVGEPEIALTDPDYMAKIRILRQLVLQKRGWERPPLSVEHAIGESRTADGAPVKLERPADIDYLHSIPTTPRDGGFFREADRKWAEELLRKGKAQAEKP
ncbi:MAG: hypothetical protein HY291_19855 [Planctomycetes bacterium]|nr:hypothetical protein [Planctomycetota bacterium]